MVDKLTGNIADINGVRYRISTKRLPDSGEAVRLGHAKGVEIPINGVSSIRFNQELFLISFEARFWAR